MAIKINWQKIEGAWQSGVALDLQTTSSTFLGHDEFGHARFDNTRSEIGEFLHQLKNRGDRNAAGPIVEAAAKFIRPYRAKFDALVPVPPSSQRALQPVIVLAEGIGRALDLPVLQCISTTRETTQLKNITDPEERKKHVSGLYAVDTAQTRGTNILLFDDLFRSGSTMNAITEVLLSAGRAASVRALAITKTRSNR
jgi:competence protein ComFC